MCLGCKHNAFALGPEFVADPRRIQMFANTKKIRLAGLNIATSSVNFKARKFGKQQIKYLWWYNSFCKIFSILKKKLHQAAFHCELSFLNSPIVIHHWNKKKSSKFGSFERETHNIHTKKHTFITIKKPVYNFFLKKTPPIHSCFPQRANKITIL
jgi:hypothetical protein